MVTSSALSRRFLIVIGLLGVVLLLLQLDGPFDDAGGWNGTWVSTCARNHVKYGLGSTQAACVMNTDFSEPEEFRYYVHHPPGIHLTVAASFLLFGEHEWAARVVPMLFTIGTFVLFFLLLRLLYDTDTSLLATTILAVLPMVILAGSMVNHEAPSGFFILLVTYALERWQGEHKRRWLGIAAGGFLVGAQFGWPVFYLAGLYPLLHLLARRNIRETLRLWWLPALAVVAFAVFVAQTSAAVGEQAMPVLAQTFLLRTTGGNPYSEEGMSARLTRSGGQPLSDAQEEQVTWAGWSVRHIRRFLTLFGLPVLLLAGYWLISTLSNMPLRRNDLVLVFLSLLGLAHILLFRQGAFQHWYWSYYLSFGLAAAAARGTRLLYHDRSGMTNTDRGQALSVLIALLIAGNTFIALRDLTAHSRVGLLPRDLIIPSLLRADARWTVAWEVGRVIDSVELPGGAVATNLPFNGPQLAYYARRRVFFADDLPEAGQFDRWARRNDVAGFALLARGAEGDEWMSRLESYALLRKTAVLEDTLRVYSIQSRR